MQRRTLLTWMAGVAAGAVVPSWAGAMARDAVLAERMGIQLYTVRALLRQDFDGTLRALGRIGYREVELAGWYDRTPRAWRTALQSAQLTATSSHVELADLRADAARVIGTHVDAGIGMLVLAWINVSERQTIDDWRRLADELNGFARVAKRAGLTFAYHNHEYEFVRIGRELPMDTLTTRTDPALVRLELDMYWAVAAGADPLSWINRWPGRVVAVHVKDRTKDGRMVDVGAGVIPFATLLKAARAHGLKHWYVEHDEPTDALAFARASHRWLAKLPI